MYAGRGRKKAVWSLTLNRKEEQEQTNKVLQIRMSPTLNCFLVNILQST